MVHLVLIGSDGRNLSTIGYGVAVRDGDMRDEEDGIVPLHTTLQALRQSANVTCIGLHQNLLLGCVGVGGRRAGRRSWDQGRGPLPDARW